EEIESMGRTEKRELISRLKVLLLHLLKWRFQPVGRSVSWQLTIKEQRREVARHLADNPSLKARLSETMADAYGDAIIATARETSMPEEVFPTECPWAFEQIMDGEFWPERGAAS
ncbi:MAG: DUF29 domain-containing protein, partial [Alphaproteobacteria bacterium]|nr:DUF29 domain-containing protein [Alphaproteobacteria bacterium]